LSLRIAGGRFHRAPLGLHLAISVKLIVLPARTNPTVGRSLGGEGGIEGLVFLCIRRAGELRGLLGDDNFLGVSVGVPGAVVKSSRQCGLPSSSSSS